eukprot:g1340.t1
MPPPLVKSKLDRSEESMLFSYTFVQSALSTPSHSHSDMATKRRNSIESDGLDEDLPSPSPELIPPTVDRLFSLPTSSSVAGSISGPLGPPHLSHPAGATSDLVSAAAGGATPHPGAGKDGNQAKKEEASSGFMRGFLSKTSSLRILSRDSAKDDNNLTSAAAPSSSSSTSSSSSSSISTPSPAVPQKTLSTDPLSSPPSKFSTPAPKDQRLLQPVCHFPQLDYPEKCQFPRSGQGERKRQVCRCQQAVAE